MNAMEKTNGPLASIWMAQQLNVLQVGPMAASLTSTSFFGNGMDPELERWLNTRGKDAALRRRMYREKLAMDSDAST